jgi:hypothetical protein
MSRWVSWSRIALEIAGAIAIVALSGRFFFTRAFKDFAGGNCTDTELRLLASPDGRRTVKSFHRVCGTEKKYQGDFVYLSTGNPNPGYEYAPIAEFSDGNPGQVLVTWDGPSQLSVTYPTSAKVGDVYANVLGVRVVLHPPLPEVLTQKK